MKIKNEKRMSKIFRVEFKVLEEPEREKKNKFFVNNNAYNSKCWRDNT